MCSRFLFFTLLFTPLSILAQTRIIKGHISNKFTNETLPSATIQVVDTQKAHKEMKMVTMKLRV